MNLKALLDVWSFIEIVNKHHLKYKESDILG